MFNSTEIQFVRRDEKGVLEGLSVDSTVFLEDVSDALLLYSSCDTRVGDKYRAIQDSRKKEYNS